MPLLLVFRAGFAVQAAPWGHLQRQFSLLSDAEAPPLPEGGFLRFSGELSLERSAAVISMKSFPLMKQRVSVSSGKLRLFVITAFMTNFFYVSSD